MIYWKFMFSKWPSFKIGSLFVLFTQLKQIHLYIFDIGFFSKFSLNNDFHFWLKKTKIFQDGRHSIWVIFPKTLFNKTIGISTVIILPMFHVNIFSNILSMISFLLIYRDQAAAILKWPPRPQILTFRVGPQLKMLSMTYTTSVLNLMLLPQSEQFCQKSAQIDWTTVIGHIDVQ